MELTEKQQHEQYYDDIYAALKNEPYANHLGMELKELGEGSAKVTLMPASHMLNTHGTVHGGVIFSLADYAFAAASNSYGKTAVGVSNTINYMGASFPDHLLVAIAQEIKKTRRLAWYRIDVLSNEKLVATMEAMVFRKQDDFVGNS